MSDTPCAVLDAVRAQRDEMLAFLEQLVFHESPTSVPEAQAVLMVVFGPRSPSSRATRAAAMCWPWRVISSGSTR